MIVILLVLLLSPVISEGYQQIWGTDFPNENGYGYYGNELHLPTNEWSIDLRGVSLSESMYPDWFRVNNGVLEGIDFDYSYQLDTENVGVMWKSRIIELDNYKSYYVDFSLETSDNWDSSSSIPDDFVRIGYYDDNQQFNLIYEKSDVTERSKISGSISNTSECQLIVEVDCDSKNEVFKLYNVNLYYDRILGDSSELIITKMCSPGTYNYHHRYIQITNCGNHIIDLSPFVLDSIHQNAIIFSWELSGLILPYQSLVIGDTDASQFFCDIGKVKWSSKSPFWGGIPANNDGAQLVRNDTREITDRVVGVNFFEGYAERNPAYLLASEESNIEAWDFYSVSSSADSYPGEYIIDETLPISLFSTQFSWNDSGYLFSWSTYGEADLIGYNLYFSENSLLTNAIRINPQIISAQNSVQYNNYSFSLAEIESGGYLWLEVISIAEPNSFSQPIYLNFNHNITQEAIEVTKIPTVTIFPNPTCHNSFLQVKNHTNPVDKIKVYNIKGQLVGSMAPKYSSDTYDIHSITNKLISGIYFVSVRFKTKTVTQKLIISK